MTKFSAPCPRDIVLSVDSTLQDEGSGFGGVVRNDKCDWVTGFCGSLGEEKEVVVTELTPILIGLPICFGLKEVHPIKNILV